MDRLQQSFLERQAALRPKVEAIVRRGRVEDPEAVVAQVWLKAWRAYPRMVQLEEAAAARGAPSPHRWEGWFFGIAKRLVVDEKRREKVRRQIAGVRALRPHLDDASAEEERAYASGGAVQHAAPLDVDDVADDSGEDQPETALDRMELRATLAGAVEHCGPDERRLLGRWCAGVPDREVAAALGIAVPELRRRRDLAICRLRAVFRRNGFEVPPDGPTDSGSPAVAPAA